MIYNQKRLHNIIILRFMFTYAYSYAYYAYKYSPIKNWMLAIQKIMHKYLCAIDFRNSN